VRFPIPGNWDTWSTACSSILDEKFMLVKIMGCNETILSYHHFKARLSGKVVSKRNLLFKGSIVKAVILTKIYIREFYPNTSYHSCLFCGACGHFVFSRWG
jgi:hypothetical protein